MFHGGRIQRDWTYVDDIVDSFIAALDQPHGFEILNLGCGQPVENLCFIEILEELLGQNAVKIDVPCPPSEPLVTYANVSKARRLLGYEPKIMVEEGLKRFVAWMRAEQLI